MDKQKKQSVVTGLVFDGIICSGLGSVFYGVYLLNHPAAFIVLGLALYKIGIKGGTKIK